MGEFAIGTNTTAYVFAAKYGIGDKLPILIAEKMGPHFAVGDTCYSHEEDLEMCIRDRCKPLEFGFGLWQNEGRKQLK